MYMYIPFQLSPNSLNKICIIYLFITSIPTIIITPNMILFSFFVFFFFIFYLKKKYIFFTFTWIWCGLISRHFHYLTKKKKKKPTYKKRTTQTVGNLDDILFFNRHIFGQKTHFDISNIKSYDILIESFGRHLFTQ